MNEALCLTTNASAIRPYELALSNQARAALKKQRPRCVWLTGLSGAGKSTLANALELHLHQYGLHTFLLDGDNVRNGLCRDLGMGDGCRRENIRRMGEVARLMFDAGLIVIVAAISPFRAEREAARQLFAAGDFIEVHVSTSLEVCARRDPKGLYRAVREGRIKDFTGIDSPYEAPLAAECRIDTDALELTTACRCLAAILLKK
ncbi:adenylyl-sulfate kinase [Pseudomonas sp. B2M1-30]|uniref:Adenylyl-sulfate kinase n=1 Tax=Pseudomonas koreensis TaxID=198620 RepID=A0A9X2XI50_9PSED|nr:MULTISPECIES: adenylyl-sulfate kinase [Pseudomonas]MBV4478124.1 adenylyl-sulfate kinase [Pseudomonas botevensis]MCU0118135.1 adenylyl-sulfate kinase [Pseudomonas sp. B2M1-30]MCU7249352.1 adenylyl-sulfate kinase [Pseudomonas koreensis]MCU7264379.1 adenylyl-sulfate kinase [Pseudomonas koreensis]